MRKAIVLGVVGVVVLIGVVAAVIYTWPQASDDPRLTPTPKMEWNGTETIGWLDVDPTGESKPGFDTLPSGESGVDFSNSLKSESAVTNQILMNGSGVATGDFDGDGWVDLYFCGLDTPNKLFRNLGGFKFEDVTEAAGVACPGAYCTGCTFSDFDGDGQLDIWVTALGGPNRLFLNEGSGKFRDATKDAGLESELGSTTSALADIDLDGDLDLYVCNYRSETIKNTAGSFEAKMVDGKVVVPDELKDRIIIIDGKIQEYGEEDTLYINDGKGKFERVSIDSGRFIDEQGNKVAHLRDWGLTAQFQDIDRDGDPDLYVCNDFWTPDRIWINDGKGSFTAIPATAIRNTSTSSMSVAFGDVDRDGSVEFFVTDMLSRSHALRKRQMGAMKPTPLSIGEINNRPQYMRNSFFLNRGDTTFAEIAQFSGLDKSDWSWGSQFLDVDLDGNLDLLVTTGHAFDVQDSDVNNLIRDKKIDPSVPKLLQYPTLETRNYVFRNEGHAHFAEAGDDWGFSLVGVSHGLATADFDNDGDIDVVMNNLNAPASLLRNRTTHARLAVRLVGENPNMQAIGARIFVDGFGATQQSEVTAGGQYLSGSSGERCFACEPDSKLQIRVVWASGKEIIVNDAKPNRIYRIRESASDKTPSTNDKSVQPLFEDASQRINHTHIESPFDDFAKQPLLPNRFSQLGPGVAWYDVDNDGREDLLIGSGRGGNVATYRNTGDGNFEKAGWLQGMGQLGLDSEGLVAFANPDGSTFLSVGISSFENPSASSNAAEFLQFQGGAFQYVGGVTGWGSATGPLSVADIDGDGDLDVFVAGRVIPEFYPRAATSRIFLSDNGVMKPSDENAEVLNEIGLVSGSTFTDFDNDGDPDLLLAVEWGPMVLLENRNGLFVNVTAQKGLAEIRGWWLGVATGDFDEDGRLDFVATNWGENSKYHVQNGRELRIFADDFDGNGTFDIVETHYDRDFSDYVPERGLSCSSGAMPFLKTIAPTYNAWGNASLEALYGREKLEKAYMVSAQYLQHTVFLNRGDHYEPSALPFESQLAPALGVNVADFDGDGHQDLYLAQNFFAVQVETSRLDAGRGLILRGDGKGGFEPLTGAQSGVRIYGDQRGSAVADYDADGRMDLVSTQNGAQTVLLHNVGASRGLRVRLKGPQSNPTGVGSLVRAKNGPWFETQAGSGYLSQNSAVTLLQGGTAKLEVLWPGGKMVSYEVTSGAKTVSLTPDGMTFEE